MIPLRSITPGLAAVALAVGSMGCDSTRVASSTPSQSPVAPKTTLQGVAGTTAEEADEVIDLSDVPQVVLDAVHKALPGGEILVAEYEDENGQMLYGFEVRTAEGQRDIKVDAEGTVVKIENDDADEVETDADAAEVEAVEGNAAGDNDAIQEESGATGDTEGGTEDN